jgi:hypothetical protein
MGPPGVEFVYKDELRALRGSVKQRVADETLRLRETEVSEAEASRTAIQKVAQWLAGEEGLLAKRYERELMNPREALSLGSISQLVMPSDLRQVLAEHMAFHLAHYEPQPFSGVQREFH